jgi:hypothetical protein
MQRLEKKFTTGTTTVATVGEKREATSFPGPPKRSAVPMPAKLPSRMGDGDIECESAQLAQQKSKSTGTSNGKSTSGSMEERRMPDGYDTRGEEISTNCGPFGLRFRK